jgi:diguanylate cyclase (GGDEF)-like protein
MYVVGAVHFGAGEQAVTPRTLSGSVDANPADLTSPAVPLPSRPDGPPADLLTLLHRLGEGLLILDRDGVVTQASAQAARLLGRQVRDLVGHPSPVIEPRPSTSTPASAHTGRERAGLPAQRVGPVPRPSRPVRRWVTSVIGGNGVERRLLVSTARIRGGHVLSLLDLTVTEVGPQESDAERRLAAARHLTGIALWEWHVVDDALVWSDEMFALCGLPPGAAPPTTAQCVGWIHADDRTVVLAAMQQGLSDGRGFQTVFRFTPSDGRLRHLRLWCEVELSPGGMPLKVTGVTLDVTDSAAAAVELTESRRRLDAAAHLTGLASWSMRLDGSSLEWSDTMYDLYGVDPGSWEPSAGRHLELVHPADRQSYQDATTDVVRSGTPREITMRVRTPAAELRYLRCWMDVTREDDGRPRTLWGTALDVTDEETALRSLRESREELRMAFEDAPTGMLLLTVHTDGSFKLARANRALCEMFEVDRDDTSLTQALRTRVDRAALDQLRAGVLMLLSGQRERVEYGFSYQRVDGSPGYASVRAGMARGGGQLSAQLLIHVLDTTSQHRAQEELQRLALTDAITGLGNRTLFERHMRESLRHVEPGRRAVGMLLLDLDRFKVVNDSLGHVTGDRLLVEVARRLADSVPADSCVARLGGDEFAVLVDPAPGSAALLGLAHLVRERLGRPFSLLGADGVVCTASIGVTRVDDPTASVEDVYREADLALYDAKDCGRNGCAMSDEQMRAKADERIATEHRLRAALEADGVRIHLQPVVSLTDGSVVGAEALARLEHPTHGLLQPGQFIEVAEDTGLVVEIDVRVAELAITYLATVAEPDTWVAVNASPRTLAQPQYIRRIKAALSAFGVDAQRLHLEVTETSLLDANSTSAAGLAVLRELGIRAGIDDFGTGYSALAYLDRFALDFLKIDRSFVVPLGGGDELGGAGQDDAAAVASPQRAESLVSAIVALAHVYGMKVTAEGVETQEQTDALRRVGCDLVQGYLFGRPAPAPLRPSTPPRSPGAAATSAHPPAGEASTAES